MAMAKKFLLLMCMVLLIGIINLISSYTAPAYNQINMTLTSGYIAPAYNQINFTLGSSDEDITPPAITFLSQSPADLNITNAQNNKVYISFNVTDANLNDTSVKLYYKANSTTDNTMFFLNGTAYSGYFDDSYSLSPRTNITSNYTWTLLDNEIYTGTYNTGAVTIDNKVHNKVTTSNANNYYKTEYYNVSGTKQWGYFEIMANSTAGASPSSVYYCNNSYTTGNILTNNNCALISTRLATTTYDHCHTNSSCHIGFQFAINVTSQTIGSVKVTSTSYFVFGGAKNWNVFNIAETTRTGMTQSTGNKGVGWSSQTYTIDQHLHQFDNSENQTFYYYVCANDTLGNYGCSTPRVDLMEMAGLPPSSPQVYSPVENTYNIGDLISINYTASLSPNAYDIIFYNISLANPDGTFNKTIIGNNSLELGYIWDTTGTPAGEYEIKVRATDVLNQSSLGYSENFTLQEVIPTINVLPVSDVTLNGGTTKDINVLFETSSANVDDTSAQVILTNGAVERTSSGCTNVSTTFNCTITFNFYDEAGVWNINASIIDNSANLITNTTENVTINTLDYIAQDKNYFKWLTPLNSETNNQEASNTIILTNGGNQDYTTLNIKGQNATGVAYGNIINTDKFSIDNITSSVSGIHLEDNANVDMSSILNLNSHGASVTANIYAYVDVPLGIRGDNYLSSSAWGITLI